MTPEVRLGVSGVGVLRFRGGGVGKRGEALPRPTRVLHVTPENMLCVSLIYNERVHTMLAHTVSSISVNGAMHGSLLTLLPLPTTLLYYIPYSQEVGVYMVKLDKGL